MLNADPQTLVGLSYVSRFLYQSLHQAPSPEFFEMVYAEKLLEDWPVEIDNSTLEQGMQQLQTPPTFEALKEDFAQLFVGPNALGAAPWASVYLEEEQITFGKQTLAIRDVYAQFGMQIDTGEQEPDDHIGLIFCFLAHLCELTAEQMNIDENTTLCPIRLFLSDHVLTWAPRMLQLMRQNAHTDYMKGIASIAEGTLRQFAQVTGAQYHIVKLYR